MKLLKKIEIKFSNFLISMLSHKDVQVKVEEKSNIFNETNTEKVLLLRQDRIGDLVISTPLLRLLREKYPKMKIDILLSDYNYSAKDIAVPFTSEVFHFKKNLLSALKLITNLRRNKYDVVIDMYDEPSTTSSLLIKLINPKYSIGLNKEKSFVYSHIVKMLDQNEDHIVKRTAMLLLPFGIDPLKEDLSITYNIPETEKVKFSRVLNLIDSNVKVGINLSGSNKSKFWGVEKNIDLIRLLKNSKPKIDIVVLGTKEYMSELEEIKKNSDVTIAPFVSSVREYAAMLSLCNIIISPDTAAIHFASAFKIPIVPLFPSPTIGSKLPWLPYKTSYEAIYSETESIQDIKPEKVYDAFVKLHDSIIDNKIS